MQTLLKIEWHKEFLAEVEFNAWVRENILFSVGIDYSLNSGERQMFAGIGMGF